MIAAVARRRKADGSARRPAKMLGIGMSEQKIERHSGRTITRADLSEAVYQRVGLSRTESSDLVQMVLDEVCEAAVRGESVKLSSFGSFIVRSKGQRIGRNPKTGVEVPILPRRVMVFKPSNVLKARINGGAVNHKARD
jgi:integration host factor subunit alpha